MKLLLILLLILTPVANAEITPYAIERADGGVSIMYYDDTNNRFIPRQEADRQGFQGLSMTQITMTDIPADRTDRNFWKLDSGKVKVDNVKKAEKEAEKAAKQGKINSLKTRLGLTDEDLELIRRGV